MAKFESFEQIEEAVGVLAAGHLELEALVKEQAVLSKAQHERIKAQDLQIGTLIKLVDAQQAILIAAGLAKPRPRETKGGSFEN